MKLDYKSDIPNLISPAEHNEIKISFDFYAVNDSSNIWKS